MYGESCVLAWRAAWCWGLSPRVRGIRNPASGRRAMKRSIPACTGNPVRLRPREHVQRVYPRVYGESVHVNLSKLMPPGLSPRVRGIRDDRILVSPGRRSIPACTGNPDVNGRPILEPRVYPRVYGESSVCRSHTNAARGLSPRVRGIHARIVFPQIQ